MRVEKMKIKLLSVIIFLTSLFVMGSVLSSAKNLYADTLTRTSGDLVCTDSRVDFGEAEITCTDTAGVIISRWICQYDIGFTCRDPKTNKNKTGGFIPKAGDLCSHLCGRPESLWK